MSIPEQSTVLVIGGGPAGSYAAAALAREGVDVTLLEADSFPRYHVGESLLASVRHFLKFIDLDEKFDAYGFKIKKGASFKLNAKPPVYTDFIAAGGPKSYAWNVVRSESDHLMFKHAGECGAKIFDTVKVGDITFEDSEVKPDEGSLNLGKPVAASWQKKDGSHGTIKFDYLVDASGRNGVISTKYLKNRRYNQGLKNIATWGYWKGVKDYGIGTDRQGVPYFEALSDTNGWVWTIPLHDGTTSVGVVMNQEASVQRKKTMGNPTGREFYIDCVKTLVPGVWDLLKDAECITETPKAASDWSYSAPAYASPYIRIIGDAGCFIDPFFSSGVHLALASGLSAATTICASIKGDVTEQYAQNWHTQKVAEGYTRFLLVVMSSLKQIKEGTNAVISDFDEESFDRAFALFRPIIQGTVDTQKKLSQEEISKTVDFCFRAFEPASVIETEAVLKKLDDAKIDGTSPEELEKNLSADELQILKTVRARQMVRGQDMMNIDNFSVDEIDGKTINLVRGQLTLAEVGKAQTEAKGEYHMKAVFGGDERLAEEAAAAASSVVATS